MALPEVNFTKLFIDNKFVDSVKGATYTTINPATEEPICKVPKIWMFNFAKLLIVLRSRWPRVGKRTWTSQWKPLVAPSSWDLSGALWTPPTGRISSMSRLCTPPLSEAGS